MKDETPGRGRTVYTRLAGLCGVLSPLLGISLVAASIHLCPSFSWTQNYLSLLGVERSSAAAFNGGLIASGVLALGFAIGFRRSIPGVRLLRPLATLGLALGACALCAIGVFPRTTGTPHDVASAAFFVLIPVSLLLTGTAQVLRTARAWGLFTFACAVLMIVPQLVPWPWDGGAIEQMLAGGPWSLWLMAFGTRLILAREPSRLTAEQGSRTATGVD
ncbi:MAG: DUF998 domain-containing protein [Chloroflexota bacterium]|nr:DUF998 domain-containing protein [Chloroflexota bacterium]